MKLFMEDEDFRIYVQLIKVGGLNILFNAKKLPMPKLHVIWALDKTNIDKFTNMG